MKKQIAPVFFLCFVLLSNAVAEERVYDWLTMGVVSGEQNVRYFNDGRVEVNFEFNDRGRGPKIQQRIWLDSEGFPVQEEISGHSYMGAEVNEIFSLENEVAKWSNTYDSGSQKVDKKMAYIAADATPEADAILARLLLNQESKRLSLLPSGEAQILQLTKVEVSRQVKGVEEKKNVSLYAITGLGFDPNYLWLDEEQGLFAMDFSWMALVLKGWGASLKHLKEVQAEAKDEYFKKQGKQLAHSLKGTTLIQNVNLLDVEKGKLISDVEVLMAEGKIIAINQVKDKSRGVIAHRIIDGKGMTLMPGMWDMHAHVGIEDGLLNIAAGVTSVRDLGNEHSELTRNSKLFDSGEIIGPRVYKAGFVDQKSPFSAPTGKLANSLKEAIEYVDWYAERGYQQIKIYSSINPAWVKPLAQHIHQKGMKLSGHIPSFMTAEQAIKDGFDEIQHINMLFLNFLATEKDDTRTPLRFSLVGAKAGSLNLQSDEVKSFIQLLAERKIVVDPTVAIFRSMFLHKSGELDPSYAMIADHMPANVRRGFLRASHHIEDEAAYFKSANALLELIKLLYEHGVPLVAGTDNIAGFTLHRELELYAKAGIPNDEVIRIATINAAYIVGQADNYGSLIAGKKADLILVDGNPLQDINAIRKVALVIKDSLAYRPDELYSAVGIKPFIESIELE